MTNPLYYLSICAATGAVSVMALKAFGIALKLTFAGSNQFARPSTYIFAIVAIFCIIVQMNYFNKALSTFPQSMYAFQCKPYISANSSSVSPIYYVTFTTAVLTASFVLFQGFNVTSVITTTRLLCGFLIIFLGVYMLNYSSKDLDSPEFERLTAGSVPSSPGVLITRFSMQGLRPSNDSHRQLPLYEADDDGYVLQPLARRSEDRETLDDIR